MIKKSELELAAENFSTQTRNARALIALALIVANRRIAREKTNTAPN